MAHPIAKGAGEGGITAEETLQHVQTSESVLIPIPKDVFEKLYLDPKQPKVGNLYRQFGNPTPVALLGFLISASPSGCILMGWRGAGGNGGAILPAFIFFGGMLQILGAIGEWILGNTFSCTLFSTYGCFWLYNGASLMPFFGIGTNYSSDGNSLAGESTSEFYASVGFFYVFLGLLSFFYLICSIRTNICLLMGLFILVLDIGMFIATYFHLALGNVELAGRFQIAAGAFTLSLCAPIAVIFMAEIFEAIDFPVSLPVGDLSSIVQGRNQKKSRKARGLSENQPATV